MRVAQGICICQAITLKTKVSKKLIKRSEVSSLDSVSHDAPNAVLVAVLYAYLAGFAAFYAILLSSIALYRLSPWHPLAKYPGPALAKLSKWWIIYKIIRGEQHHAITALHKKHGKIVRVGPNELSFADVDLLPAVLAPDMTRGPSE